MKSCVFFGHAKYDYEPYREKIKNSIVELIEKYAVTQFYSGGRGAFDGICSRIVAELKSDYPHLKNTLFLSYLPKGKDEFILPKAFDDSVYFLETRVPPKYAIIRTNELAVQRADFVVSGVRYSWGGAARAVEFARKKGKRVFSVI